jgi:glutathione synthase/RimK-type ligase-like ATP-grasp enzyme
MKKTSDDDWLRLAIIYEEKNKYSPSNKEAICKFRQAAYEKRIETIITDNDYVSDRLWFYTDFDLYFIRDTTNLDNYTYHIAKTSENLGIKVLDTPLAIRIGCDKLWHMEKFKRHNIPFPRTKIISEHTWEDVSDSLKYPLVIKVPDLCFSQGVDRAENREDYNRIVYKLFYNSAKRYEKIILQEFIKTDFDWRIGILDKKILFACKYYMADNDWRILKYDRKGHYVEGAHEAMWIHEVPIDVLKIAVKCTNFLDDGLYGIDIKETKHGVYAIEINDNPNIDSGVEDQIEGEKLYNTIIDWYLK